MTTIYKTVRKDSTIVMGIGSGSEDLTKITQYLSKDAKYVVKSLPGQAYTVNSIPPSKFGEFRLEMIPVGIVEGKIAIIGPGMIIDPKKLVREFVCIQKGRLIDVTPENLKISDRAIIRFPMEEKMAIINEREKKSGNTNLYLRQVLRDRLDNIAIRMIDFVDGSWKWKIDKLMEPLMPFMEEDKYKLIEKHVVESFSTYQKRLKGYICNTQVVLSEAVQKRRSILFEGGYSFYDSMTHGDLHFSAPIEADASAILSASCMGPLHADYVFGVLSPYMAINDNRYLPTEITDDNEKKIVSKILFGANPPSQVKCAYPDLVMAKHAIGCNEINCFAIDRLDILGKIGLELGGIKVCTAYDYIPYKKAERPIPSEEPKEEAEDTLAEEQVQSQEPSNAQDNENEQSESLISSEVEEDGEDPFEMLMEHHEEEEHQVICYVPTDIQNAKPIFHETVFEGWEIPKDCKRYEDLPEKAREFLDFIQQYLDLPINCVGVGPNDDDIIQFPYTLEDFSTFFTSVTQK